MPPCKVICIQKDWKLVGVIYLFFTSSWQPPSWVLGSVLGSGIQCGNQERNPYSGYVREALKCVFSLPEDWKAYIGKTD